MEEERRISTFTILRGYVLREFLLSLLVAFLFFFFIFFINQLLLFAQKILLKNVNLWSVLQLVALSVPQILLYTIPFSTLSAASMVIGDLSARNEILALRTVGISLRRMFEIIAFMALLLAFLTFFVADVMLPWSHQRFKVLYAELLRDLPTMEIESYAVNQIGDIILVTGEVKGTVIKTLVLIDTAESQVITASEGEVTLIDLNSFLYRLDVSNPVILKAESSSVESFTLADAEKMTYYLDFSNQIARFSDVTPSQLSTRDLLASIAVRKQDLEQSKSTKISAMRTLQEQRAQLLRELPADNSLVQQILDVEREIASLEKKKDQNFYLQYYWAELHKKIALSASCFILVFITFPLSFLRLKHGRLFGFGLSLLVASSYWFLLFFAQTKILDVTINPGYLIWAPNLIIALAATLLLLAKRRL
ncbi:MAG: LptF/LptG family permease [Sphaerochaetaceae bacterium]|jgi:lipopolysaccharide export system permease protein|nr:LptF/LptG family permease [Sphaerochaetaceae bacterium]